MRPRGCASADTVSAGAAAAAPVIDFAHGLGVAKQMKTLFTFETYCIWLTAVPVHKIKTIQKLNKGVWIIRTNYKTQI
jgi:hypothetical protein